MRQRRKKRPRRSGSRAAKYNTDIHRKRRRHQQERSPIGRRLGLRPRPWQNGERQPAQRQPDADNGRKTPAARPRAKRWPLRVN